MSSHTLPSCPEAPSPTKRKDRSDEKSKDHSKDKGGHQGVDEKDRGRDRRLGEEAQCFQREQQHQVGLSQGLARALLPKPMALFFPKEPAECSFFLLIKHSDY